MPKTGEFVEPTVFMIAMKGRGGAYFSRFSASLRFRSAPGWQ